MCVCVCVCVCIEINTYTYISMYTYGLTLIFREEKDRGVLCWVKRHPLSVVGGSFGLLPSWLKAPPSHASRMQHAFIHTRATRTSCVPSRSFAIIMNDHHVHVVHGCSYFYFYF